MNVKALNEKSQVSLTLQEKELLYLTASKTIESQKMHLLSLDSLTPESAAMRGKIVLKPLKAGWKVSAPREAGWRNWWITCRPLAIIFPTREGEYISNPTKLGNYQTYSLSYPGTASSKCVILFFASNSGVLVGSKPSLDWAKLSLTRNGTRRFTIKLLQKNQHLYLIPFSDRWETAVDEFKSLFTKNGKASNSHRILDKPRFFLQMGARDFFGRSHIKKFSDLLPFIKLFRSTVGEGHFVHLFGTNAAGFDCNFPDFRIDPKLGGKLALSRLVNQIHQMGLITSHHFNPRIADIHWLDRHPGYQEAIVLAPNGNPWIEFYKHRLYAVMNPNNQKWLSLCLKTIRYLKSIGFDYIELDQVAYQRNLFTPEGGFGPGYQKLIDRTKKESVKFWLEGVSDVFAIPADCFFQVLSRDRVEFWETNENRRGYPYGTAFTRFYRRLMPSAPISFQLVTEKCKVNLIRKRLAIARKLNAQILDLEMGFVDKTYAARLDKTLKKISKLNSSYSDLYL